MVSALNCLLQGYDLYIVGFSVGHAAFRLNLVCNKVDNFHQSFQEKSRFCRWSRNLGAYFTWTCVWKVPWKQTHIWKSYILNNFKTSLSYSHTVFFFWLFFCWQLTLFISYIFRSFYNINNNQMRKIEVNFKNPVRNLSIRNTENAGLDFSPLQHICIYLL